MVTQVANWTGGHRHATASHSWRLLRVGLVLGAAVIMAVAASSSRVLAEGEATFDVPLTNASFRGGVDSVGIPAGWSRYGGGGRDQHLQVLTESDGSDLLQIVDGDPTAEIGVFQRFPLQGGQTYRASARVRALANAGSAGAHLQLRFLPSNQLVQTDLAARSTVEFTEVAVEGTAPSDTTHGVIYL